MRLLAALLLAPSLALAFDHAPWDALLKKHVVVLDQGRASQLRYVDIGKERTALQAYLRDLSGVRAGDFERWPRAEQMAFLINAYNAFTVEKVLTRYPALDSIRDFGRVFGNPFRDRFFNLFGEPFSLDRIEHDVLRKRYADPRIHYALNCASVGCPMLREEAYVAARLEQQLEEQALRFLSDRTRNRVRDGKLEVSRIFDWFGEDFEPREAYFARHAATLGLPAGAPLPPLSFLDYDWSLNDFRSSSRR
jgi:hypothetical protein